jgi:pantothenate kinase
MNRLVSSNEALLQSLCSINDLRYHALEENKEKPIVNWQEVTEIVLKGLKANTGKRIIVGIAGFPASGKTSGAVLLARKLNELRTTNLAAHLPMDGFHFSNRRLISEGLEGIKGDIATYDVAAYVRKLLEFKRCDETSLFSPDYDRTQHEVVNNKIEILAEVRALVTEGIYVGYPASKWGEVRSLLDILFYLDATPEDCADRIVTRNIYAGREERVVQSKLQNDFNFMKKSIMIVGQADYIIRSW